MEVQIIEKVWFFKVLEIPRRLGTVLFWWGPTDRKNAGRMPFVLRGKPAATGSSFLWMNCSSGAGISRSSNARHT
jgi:hypothetical protein